MGEETDRPEDGADKEVKITYLPEGPITFIWEYCHELDSGHDTQFWEILPYADN